MKSWCVYFYLFLHSSPCEWVFCFCGLYLCFCFHTCGATTNEKRQQSWCAGALLYILVLIQIRLYQSVWIVIHNICGYRPSWTPLEIFVVISILWLKIYLPNLKIQPPDRSRLWHDQVEQNSIFEKLLHKIFQSMTASDIKACPTARGM